MKLLKAILVLSMVSFFIAADISGGDILLHDLQPLNRNLGTPSGDIITGCGAPPAGHFIWLDGSDTNDGAAAVDGRWVDKSREGRVFTSTNVGYEPINNLGYVQFDGIDDHLSSALDSNWSELFSSSDYFCSSLINNETGGSHAIHAFFATYATGAVGRPNYQFAVQSNATARMGINSGTAAGNHLNMSKSFAEPANWYQFDAVYDRAALTGEIFIDGSSIGFSGAVGAANVAPITSYYYYEIGAIRAQTGAGIGTPSWEFKGGIAQIICYTDLSKQAEVKTWLDCKKGEL